MVVLPGIWKAGGSGIQVVLTTRLIDSLHLCALELFSDRDDVCGQGRTDRCTNSFHLSVPSGTSMVLCV